jgi:flagellar export protein FliJ
VSRLPVVQRLRALLERRALGAYAAAEREVAEAESGLAARRTARLNRPMTSGPLSPLQLRALELSGVAAEDAVTAAAQATEDARERRDEAGTALTEAAMRRKAVERLHQRREADHARVAQEAAQRSLDELAVLRHAGSRWR